jgi:hypothetical protein
VGKVAEYLQKMGWAFRATSESTVLTGISVGVPFFSCSVPVEILETEHWVSIRAVLVTAVPSDQRSAVLEALSIWNASSHLVKYFVVADVLLLVYEQPAGALTLPAFVEMVRVVSRHVERTGPELMVLATNPSVAALYTSVQARSLPCPVSASQLVELPADFKLQMNRLAD